MIVSDRPALTSLVRIFLLVIIVGWQIVGQGVAFLTGMMMYGQDFLMDAVAPQSHPEVKIPMLIAQGMYSLIGLIIVPWFYLTQTENKNIKAFFHPESKWPVIAGAIALGIISLSIAMSPVSEWNANFQFPEWMSGFGNWAKELEEMAKTVTDAITNDLTPFTLMITFTVVAILPAIGEELVFRGLIQNEMIRATRNPHVGIWISAMIFSAIHLQFYGFIPRMLIGAFLGYLYFWSGNLLIPMLAHFFNNGIQVIGIYLYQKGVLQIDLESTDSAPWPLVLFSLVLMAALLYYLRNHFTSRSTISSDRT